MIFMLNIFVLIFLVNSPIAFILFLGGLFGRRILMAYLWKIVSCLVGFSLLIIYWGGIMILFGYACAVIPNMGVSFRPVYVFPVILLGTYGGMELVLGKDFRVLPFFYHSPATFYFLFLVLFILIFLILISNKTSIRGGTLRAFF